MEKRTLGRTGLSVSPLGFGGSEIGYRGATPDTVTRLLNAALDAGLNVIDTAECYKNSEELIGQAVAHRRKDFHLFTKVGHEHGWDKPHDWSAESIARTIERSLKRLRTDCVDLVQLHSCGVDILEKGEAVAALQRARSQGKTRFIGYSGDDAPALHAVTSGLFDTLQTSVSIADQQSIDVLLPITREKNMGVIAKRPIANAAWRDAVEPAPSVYHHTYWKRLKALSYEFLKDWERSNDAASIALRFTLSQPGVHTAIVGTTNPERWKQNAAMLDAGPLPKDQIDVIRAAWKRAASPDWVGQV
ncbi:MAG: aldo/keto reductase [Phycisphaerae bacterium]|nr:aldo/keto reductase [Phycisphaerae bacterium]